MKSCLGETAKEVIENMLSHLEKEYEEVESFLSPQEVEAYRQYYREMPIRQLPAGRRLSFYRRFCRGYLRYMVTQMLGWNGPTPVILDAGSGLGTQSILFALLGARVHGVDLREDRVVISQKRVGCWEREFGAKLDARFSCESLFKLPVRETFDFVWICQAISHIDPAEDFLKLTHRLLKPGGQVVLHDPNGLFIPNQIQQLRHRGLRVHQTLQTRTGEIVPYAVERLFSYGGIKRLLRQCGFEIAHGECFFGRFRGKTDDRAFERFIRPLDTLPIISDLFGYSYVVAGRKPFSGIASDP